MPARLHHERVFQSDTTPARWLIVTHGIYGTGANWRGIARKINARRPEWGVVLVDLRLHGRSEAGEPPHTVDACAEDLRALIESLGDAAEPVVAGHSFGGKVAMALRPKLAVAATWILDSTPSARPEVMAQPGNPVVRFLDLMDRMPRRWSKREDFVAAIVADGQDAGTAQWFAMNLVPVGDETRDLELRLDSRAMRALLVDYHARDTWSEIYEPGSEVAMVIAEKSATVSAADRERLATAPSHVHVHYVEAGHWLHVEKPDAVVELFAAHLP